MKNKNDQTKIMYSFYTKLYVIKLNIYYNIK
jgi:hypothetical protein